MSEERDMSEKDEKTEATEATKFNLDYLSKIPPQIKALDQWTLWDSVKCPIDAKDLSTGSTTNCSKWCSFEKVIKAYRAHKGHSIKRFDKFANGGRGDYVKTKIMGIGFVFTKNDKIMGIDLDKAISGDGEERILDPFSKNIIKYLDTYVEVSPSGKGFHILCLNNNPMLRPLRAKYIHKYSRNEIDYQQEIEIYSEGRFFTITGDKYKISNDNITTNGIESFINQFNELLTEKSSKDHTITRTNSLGEVTEVCIGSSLYPFSMYDVLKIQDALGTLDGGDESTWYNYYTRGIARTASENPKYHDRIKRIWDDWSQQYDGYNSAENDSRWERAKAETTEVTIGSLFLAAKEQGGVAKRSYHLEEKDVVTSFEDPASLQDGIAVIPKETPADIPDEPEHWEYITDRTIESAIAGTWFADVCTTLRSFMSHAVTGEPRPLGMVFGKALVICGSTLAAPERGFQSMQEIEDRTYINPSERGIARSKFKIMTVTGMTTNLYSLLLAGTTEGKDIGNPLSSFHVGNVLANGGGSFEGLLDALIEKGNGILKISEFASYLMANNDYRAQCREGLMVLWNVGYYDQILSQRKKGAKNRHVDYAFPSIIANLQKERFRSLARQKFLDDGLLGRFIITASPHNVNMLEWLPSSAVSKSPTLIDNVNKAIEHYARLTGEVHVPDGYLKRLQLEFAHSEARPEVWRRLCHEIAPKIACILQADGKPITDDTWERIEWIIRWLYSMAHDLIKDAHVDDDIAKIDDKCRAFQVQIKRRIKKLGVKGLTKSQLDDCTIYNKTKGLREKAALIQMMIDSRLIREVNREFFPVEEKIVQSKLKYKERLFPPMVKYHLPVETDDNGSIAISNASSKVVTDEDLFCDDDLFSPEDKEDVGIVLGFDEE